MNPFDVLGIPRTSTKEEVKAAFRVLVKKHHPDKGGDGNAFRIIKAAYDDALAIAPKERAPGWAKRLILYRVLTNAIPKGDPFHLTAPIYIPEQFAKEGGTIFFMYEPFANSIGLEFQINFHPGATHGDIGTAQIGRYTFELTINVQ